MVRRELLTNFQVDRILAGKRDGYHYGKYRVLYMVGSGTFARVYRAVDRETNKVRAVKVLRKRYADDLVTTEQFLREARMVMPLRHPNIVPVYDVLEDHHRPFMVMDFVEGQNLRDFIKIHKRLQLPVSLRLTADVLAGLDYALSKASVTHRDMKLSNVLISSHGRAKLVDFGLAAISADMSEAAIAAAPNPRSIDYAGLERVTGVRKNDTRSDLYFVGVMLYHMLTGHSPLYETRDRIKRLSVRRYREITPLNQLAPELPNYVIAMVNRAMDLKVERRYQSPAEMLDELRRVTERVKKGDPGVRISDRAPETAETQPVVPQEAPLEQEGESRTVMLVESNIKMQDSIRAALKKRGYRVLVISDPQRALGRLEEHDEPEPLADCVIFSTAELGESAVDAFNSLAEMEETKATPAILLVRKDNSKLSRRAEVNEHRLVLPMGGKIRNLRQTLLRLLNQQATSERGSV
jgi:serine/threonine protein kinase